jgi:hypothetical protein
VLDEVAKSYIDHGQFADAAVVENLVGQIDDPAQRATHLLIVTRTVLALTGGSAGGGAKYLSRVRDIEAALAQAGPRGLGVKQELERDLRRMCTAWAGEARATRNDDTMHLAREALVAYHRIFPTKTLPVQPGTRDWNPAYAGVDSSDDAASAPPR